MGSDALLWCTGVHADGIPVYINTPKKKEMSSAVDGGLACEVSEESKDCQAIRVKDL